MLTDEQVAKAVHAAAIEWCGEKERETFPEDIRYFESNWRHLHGFLARVEKHVALMAAATAEGGAE